MKGFARRLIRLYPAAWRERYGDELLALLDDIRLSVRDLPDLCWGALLAHLYEWRNNHMRPISLTAVVALFAAAAVPMLALTLPGVVSEGTMEFLLLVAPVLVAPAIGPLSNLYPASSPRLNRATRLLGQGAAAAAFAVGGLSALVSAFRPEMEPAFLPGTAAFVLGMGGLAVWFVLNGWLGLRGGVVPAPLSLLSMVFGLALVFVIVVSVQAFQSVLPRDILIPMMNVVTPLWLTSFVVWTVWTGIWLWRQRAAGNSAAQLA